MIPGAPLRGLRRSARLAWMYTVRFQIVALPFIVFGAEFLFSGTDPGAVLLLVLMNLGLGLGVMFPSAVAANLFILRVLGLRSWRNERSKAWSAAILGNLFVWGGGIAALILSNGPPAWMKQQSRHADEVFIFGWYVLLSNLALLVVWLQPRPSTP